MKFFLIPLQLISIYVLFIISGCSVSSGPNDPNQSPVQSSGTCSLNFNPSEIPAGVARITATLKRSGFDSLYQTLSVNNDSTASINFTSVTVGTWHLLVKANSSAGSLMYIGETDINVLSNQTVLVNLQLQPAGQGTGNILITVSWGSTIPSLWSDCLYNPVISPAGSGYDYNGAAQPKVIFDGTKYKMYYTGITNNSVKYILYAESLDGSIWTKPVNIPVIIPGAINAWDAGAVHAGAIIFENNVYKMYYTGWSNQYSNWSIGLATSTDGKIWEKRSYPVIVGGTNGFENQIYGTSILKKDSTYYLYYTIREYPDCKIGLATSPDGINWTRYSGNPILSSNATWEGSGISDPSVIKSSEGYKMIFGATSLAGFGLATSEDGIHWAKSVLNPVFKANETVNGWACADISYPNYIVNGSRERIYYSGMGISSFYKIGFAEKR